MDKNKRGLFHLIWSDFQRRAEVDNKKHPITYILTLILNQPLFGLVIYRISHFLYTKKLILPAKLLVSLNNYLCCLFIDPAAIIGERFCITHTFSILIHGNVEIGDNVTICQGVDIGIGPRKGWSKSDKVIIKDNAMIFSGAKIIGKITIGRNARIGVNSVVLDSIPDNALAVGLPAKVVRIEKEGEGNVV